MGRRDHWGEAAPCCLSEAEEAARGVRSMMAEAGVRAARLMTAEEEEEEVRSLQAGEAQDGMRKAEEEAADSCQEVPWAAVEAAVQEQPVLLPLAEVVPGVRSRDWEGAEARGFLRLRTEEVRQTCGWPASPLPA